MTASGCTGVAQCTATDLRYVFLVLPRHNPSGWHNTNTPQAETNSKQHATLGEVRWKVYAETSRLQGCGKGLFAIALSTEGLGCEGLHKQSGCLVDICCDIQSVFFQQDALKVSCFVHVRFK